MDTTKEIKAGDTYVVAERMRERLELISVYPTELGIASAPREAKKLRQDAHQAIDKLAPADLFSVWLIADSLNDNRCVQAPDA